MNFEQARFNMIEQQIRTWEVLDQKVLDAIAALRREDFVPEQYRRLAFSDMQIPLGHGEVMMAPKVEARIAQSLEIRSSDEILEVGTGSGYLAALLARLGRSVTSVDIHADFSAGAALNLKRAGIDNVRVETGDAVTAWPPARTYDAIAVSGSLPMLTPAFQQSLRAGGRLFVIVGEPPVMEALLITRVGPQEWSRESLFETAIPPLIGAPRPNRFEL